MPDNYVLFRPSLLPKCTIMLNGTINALLNKKLNVGETGARSYRGRLLQGHFMQNYYIDGEIADSSSILIHQGNY